MSSGLAVIAGKPVVAGIDKNARLSDNYKDISITSTEGRSRLGARREKMTDICIIGAGVAGLTAAIYARRAGLSCVVLEKNIYGGQMAESAQIDNYPGMPATDGVTIANAVYEQAAAQGAEVLFEAVESVTAGERFTVRTTAGTHEARAVIIAGGAKRRLLGCDGEERLSGKGVSYCATCDGAFFRGKTVAVNGGGNTALEDALFLANLCEKVYLIHRRDEFRADRVLVEAALRHDRIETVMDAQVSAITGDRTVDGLEIAFRDGSSRRLEVSGIFIAIGLVPDNGMFAELVELDGSGYIVAGETGETSREGVFAAGDCRTKQLRQIVTAASDGANAAFSAAAWLAKRG